MEFQAYCVDVIQGFGSSIGEIVETAPLAQLLNALTKKGASFLWSQDCGAAFRKLKGLFLNKLVLVMPYNTNTL